MSEQKDKKDRQSKKSEVVEEEGAVCCSQPRESNQDKTFEQIADDWLSLLVNQMNQTGREIGSVLGKNELDKEKAVDILDSILATREKIDEAAIVASICKIFQAEKERLLKDLNNPEGRKILSEYEEKLKAVVSYYRALEKEKNRKVDENLQELRIQEHLFFISRLFDFFYRYYDIKLSTYVEGEKQYYVMRVARAVLGISAIYRYKWREIFYSIKRNIFLEEKFMDYCCMVPDEKFGPYFYNVLQRIAVIFEMALFCFEHGYNMFEIAVNCAAYFLDVDFFADAGDWDILQEAATIVDILTTPLRCCLVCDKSNLRSFSDIIQELVETDVIDEGDRIYLLLQELNEVFESKSKRVQTLKGESSKKRDSPKRRSSEKDSSAASRNRDGREILIDYFKYWLKSFSDNPDSAESRNWETGQEYVLDLEYWISDAAASTKKQEIDEVEKILSDLNLDSGSQTAGKRVKSSPKAGPSGLQTESPEANTGAIPKRTKQKVKRKALPFEHDQTVYVEDLIELYRNTLPSFLKTYLHKHFLPRMQDERLFDTTNACFIIPTDLLMERKKIFKQKTRKQKRLWAESPLGFQCPVPLQVERMLDTSIMNGDYTTVNLGLGRSLSFIGPEKSMRPWNIRCTLDEVINPHVRGEKALKKYKNLLKSMSDPHSNIVEADLETVQNLRMVEETLKVALPASALAESESQSESAKRKKHKKKKSKK